MESPGVVMVGLVMIGLVACWIIAAWRAAPKRKRSGVRRKPFKVRHDLNRRQPIAEFEAKMIRGMFAEGREVFVTAFCNETDVLRVTATIGSAFMCRPSDRVDLWGERALKLGATQVRQYHNHPDVLGRSRPSPTDLRTNALMRRYVEPKGVQFTALLVYKGMLGNAVIKEYQ